MKKLVQKLKFDLTQKQKLSTVINSDKVTFDFCVSSTLFMSTGFVVVHIVALFKAYSREEKKSRKLTVTYVLRDGKGSCSRNISVIVYKFVEFRGKFA